MLPYEACNLGSINLLAHVKSEMDLQQRGKRTYVIDTEELSTTVRLAVRFLDDVIDVNCYPLPEINDMTRKTRKIGLGVMGFADTLFMLGIPYNSQRALDIADNIMHIIESVAVDESRKLATERGAAPAYDYIMDYDIAHLQRNVTVTTIAPTGTISIIAGVSSGIEPVFALAYYKNVMDNDKLVEANPILIDQLKKRGIYSDALMDEIIEKGSLAHIESIPADIREVFVCAHDITPEWHIKMQAAFQKHTDNAVSKTVNFPKTATKDDVRKAYMMAYELGCKGTTIYRDGSRESQVLNIGKVSNDSPTAAPVESVVSPDLTPRDRPETVVGFTKKVSIGCGNLYVTINHDDDGVCEVFTNTGRTGGCPSQSEATARLASIALRSGVSIDEIIRQLKGIRCPSCQRSNKVTVMSCPDAIGRMLEQAKKDLDKKHAEVGNTDLEETVDHSAKQGLSETVETNSSELKFAKYCPECGSPLEHEGGCSSCRNCGWSKCGL